MIPNNDFSSFSARAYLEELYPTLNPENKFLLKFYHDFYASIPKQHTLLELGGGPTIFQLLSAARKIDEITFSEYAANCRDEVELFLRGDPQSWNWDTYIQFEIGLEKSSDTIESMKRLLKSKIKRVIPCDVYKENPLEPEHFSRFDVLTMGGVVECIASTEDELLSGFRNSFSLLKPGGYFVGFFAKNFTRWKNQNNIYEIFPINEAYVTNMFSEFGMQIITMTPSIPPDYHYEYEGIFAVSAVKNINNINMIR